jgi:hypothetical protein
MNFNLYYLLIIISSLIAYYDLWLTRNSLQDLQNFGRGVRVPARPNVGLGARVRALGVLSVLDARTTVCTTRPGASLSPFDACACGD